MAHPAYTESLINPVVEYFMALFPGRPSNQLTIRLQCPRPIELPMYKSLKFRPSGQTTVQSSAFKVRWTKGRQTRCSFGHNQCVRMRFTLQFHIHPDSRSENVRDKFIVKF